MATIDLLTSWGVRGSSKVSSLRNSLVGVTLPSREEAGLAAEGIGQDHVTTARESCDRLSL